MVLLTHVQHTTWLTDVPLFDCIFNFDIHQSGKWRTHFPLRDQTMQRDQQNLLTFGYAVADSWWLFSCCKFHMYICSWWKGNQARDAPEYFPTSRSKHFLHKNIPILVPSVLLIELKWFYTDIATEEIVMIWWHKNQNRCRSPDCTDKLQISSGNLK
jgi:hypothetical protein